ALQRYMHELFSDKLRAQDEAVRAAGVGTLDDLLISVEEGAHIAWMNAPDGDSGRTPAAMPLGPLRGAPPPPPAPPVPRPAAPSAAVAGAGGYRGGGNRQAAGLHARPLASAGRARDHPVDAAPRGGAEGAAQAARSVAAVDRIDAGDPGAPHLAPPPGGAGH